VSTFELKAEKLGFLQNPDSSNSHIDNVFFNAKPIFPRRTLKIKFCFSQI
jgi:hypothetical protein